MTGLITKIKEKFGKKDIEEKIDDVFDAPSSAPAVKPLPLNRDLPDYSAPPVPGRASQPVDHDNPYSRTLRKRGYEPELSPERRFSGESETVPRQMDEYPRQDEDIRAEIRSMKIRQELIIEKLKVIEEMLRRVI